jgi:hypothetical protein
MIEERARKAALRMTQNVAVQQLTLRIRTVGETVGGYIHPFPSGKIAPPPRNWGLGFFGAVAAIIAVWIVITEWKKT